eukprot:360648-Chlamydomonas_euryale.AAC.3
MGFAADLPTSQQTGTKLTLSGRPAGCPTAGATATDWRRSSGSTKRARRYGQPTGWSAKAVGQLAAGAVNEAPSCACWANYSRWCSRAVGSGRCEESSIFGRCDGGARQP